jgi:hypothetical protein
MAYNLLLLLMMVAALSVCRAIRWHKIRLVCRSEGAHLSVHVTLVCVPIWRSTPIGPCHVGWCAELKEHTHRYMSLRFVCRSEGACPSVRHFGLCADLKEHTHWYITGLCADLKEHTHRYITSLCADLKEHTHWYMSLQFVCRSEEAHPSVHVTYIGLL